MGSSDYDRQSGHEGTGKEAYFESTPRRNGQLIPDKKGNPARFASSSFPRGIELDNLRLDP